MADKFHSGDYVFVIDASPETIGFNRFHSHKPQEYIGRRIKVQYYSSRYIGNGACTRLVYAAGLFWFENELMSVEEHRAEKKMRDLDFSKQCAALL